MANPPRSGNPPPSPVNNPPASLAGPSPSRRSDERAHLLQRGKRPEDKPASTTSSSRKKGKARAEEAPGSSSSSTPPTRAAKRPTKQNDHKTEKKKENAFKRFLSNLRRKSKKDDQSTSPDTDEDASHIATAPTSRLASTLTPQSRLPAWVAPNWIDRYTTNKYRVSDSKEPRTEKPYQITLSDNTNYTLPKKAPYFYEKFQQNEWHIEKNSDNSPSIMLTYKDFNSPEISPAANYKINIKQNGQSILPQAENDLHKTVRYVNKIIYWARYVAQQQNTEFSRISVSNGQITIITKDGYTLQASALQEPLPRVKIRYVIPEKGFTQEQPLLVDIYRGGALTTNYSTNYSIGDDILHWYEKIQCLLYPDQNNFEIEIEDPLLASTVRRHPASRSMEVIDDPAQANPASGPSSSGAKPNHPSRREKMPESDDER